MLLLPAHLWVRSGWNVSTSLQTTGLSIPGFNVYMYFLNPKNSRRASRSRPGTESGRNSISHKRAKCAHGRSAGESPVTQRRQRLIPPRPVLPSPRGCACALQMEGNDCANPPLRHRHPAGDGTTSLQQHGSCPLSCFVRGLK